MRAKAGSFFLGFFLTSLVLLPLVAVFITLSARQQETQETAESQGEIRVQPGAQNIQTLLLTMAGEQPDFLLLRLDAPANEITLAVIPRQSVVITPEGSATLEESYAAAGPARAAALLGDTLSVSVPCYLAASPEVYDAVLGGEPFRVNLSGYLSREECKSLDLEETVITLTAAQAKELAGREELRRDLGAAVSMALWESAIRQNLEQASQWVERLRKQSGKLLTNLTALDLARLETTLTHLSSTQPTIGYQVLPGHFVGRKYEFNRDTLLAAQTLLG